MYKTQELTTIFSIFVLAALAMLAIAALAAIPDTHHAVQKHGGDARAAVDYIRNLGNEALKCRYDCPDGTIHFVCRLPGLTKWAIAIYKSTQLITAWITDRQSSALRYMDGCRPYFNFAHP